MSHNRGTQTKDGTVKMKQLTMVTVFLILVSSNALAVQINGIEVPQQITQSASKQTLTLNGAGVRTKFVFDIYVGALYLNSVSKDEKQILSDSHSKRISMRFLYDKIDKEKMTNGWTDAFEDNLTDKQFASLKPSIDKFNSAFVKDTLKGDVVLIDLVNDKQTIITINNDEKVRIDGADFQRAVLSIWLGESPADDELKQDMLGISED